MRIIVAAVIMWCLSGPNAWAQPAGSGFTWTAGAVVGAGRTWDDEGQIGSGLQAGGQVDRRLFGNTFAEVALDYLRHDRTGGFAAKGDTVLVTGAILQRFGHGDTQPYVLGGIALAHHSGTFGFPELNLVSRTTSTNLGYVLGAGLAIRAGARFEIGPEARFLTFAADADSSPAFACWVGGRLGVRF